METSCSAIPTRTIPTRNGGLTGLISAITKTRVKSFQELIAKDKVYSCERHFASDDIEIFCKK